MDRRELLECALAYFTRNPMAGAPFAVEAAENLLVAVDAASEPAREESVRAMRDAAGELEPMTGLPRDRTIFSLEPKACMGFVPEVRALVEAVGRYLKSRDAYHLGKRGPRSSSLYLTREKREESLRLSLQPFQDGE